MQIIPVQAVGNQTLTVLLSNQSTRLNIYQTLYGLFMDVFVNDEPIVQSVQCENLNRIVRDLYLGFAGDFLWDDLQGTSDPSYSGLGSRFVLTYLAPSDLPAGLG